MNQQQLAHLLEKYEAGTCSQAELNELADWYRQLNMPLNQQSVGDDIMAKGMLADFKHRLNIVQPQVKTLNFSKYLRVAAVLLLGVTISVFLFRYTYSTSGNKVIVSAPTYVRANNDRFIQLPDGSRVTLKAGSHLAYTNSFNIKTREVSLVGEAYFDVKHDKTRPFIIRTGAVSTRVLGTAFNIKAYSTQPKIVVTVTRGRVSVEDKTHVLAVLTPDRQLVFNKKNATAVNQITKSNNEVKWVQRNLSFDNDTFGAVADKLAERFETPIKFDQALGLCPTTISFSGFETIEEALNVLCLTRGASYKKQNGGYIISGDGCSITNK